MYMESTRIYLDFNLNGTDAKYVYTGDDQNVRGKKGVKKSA